MRVAILCNGKDLALWQYRALERIAGEHELSVLSCGEEPSSRRHLRHAAYYALNLVTIRNRLTRRVAFPDERIPIRARFDCEPEFDRAWARLPSDALSWLRDNRIDAVVKFGLGLLHIPDAATLPIPILSYHHGDPRRFRGRPAGFWELMNGEPLIGQVVQILTNRLDSGTVLAFAESNAAAHSYRRTLVNSYALSPHLLPIALNGLAKGATEHIGAAGCNYRLPGTVQVVRFVLGRWAALARRIGYGAWTEKKWAVATCVADKAANPLDAVATAERRPWTIPNIVPPYSFYADPFFLGRTDDLLVEALHRWSGRGQILRLKGDQASPLGRLEGHASYPATIDEDGRIFIVPEVSEWRRPAIFAIEDDRLHRIADLDVDADRLLDPTLLRHHGRLYLFANCVADGPSVLHLWSSDSLFGKFERHPHTPIRVSARGSRMAGGILNRAGQLWRFGQDNLRTYGDGVLVFRISDLAENSYREEFAGEARFQSVRGPHTVNFRDGQLLFDFFVERRSPLAGVRRLVARL